MIVVDGLTYKYDSDDKQNMLAIDNLSLTIHEGEHIAVLGHNGCGKSTLAKLLNALLIPTAGSVTVDQMDTAISENLWEIRRTVGMVFQNPDNQLVATTVEEDVAFGVENLGLARTIIRQRVDEALDLVDMGEFKEKAPHLLSGGQKQRVAIAGIIAMRPKYIVFDEPTAMLDPVGRKEVIATIQKLNKEEGVTVINITHFMEEAVLADRVVVMENGHIVMQGTPREIFARIDLLKELHLDVPIMTELAQGLAQELDEFPQDIISMEEMVVALCR